MREHFKNIGAVFLTAVFFVAAGFQAFAAQVPEIKSVVDTIVLDSDMVWDDEIPADLGWKTKQDKGQWINDLKVAEDVDSIIFVINNLDKEDLQALPRQAKEETVTSGNAKKKVKKTNVTGKSRLSYFSRHGNEGWDEIFSVDCFISGDEENEKETAYGIYYPDTAFGIKDNPGSLLPYKALTSRDYWITDTEDESFGDIYTWTYHEKRPESAVKMENLKTFCNYGMILKAENEDSGYPALVVNCLQNVSANNSFLGLQIPETYMRMLIQSLDENTRIVVTDGYESLSEMGE